MQARALSGATLATVIRAETERTDITVDFRPILETKGGDLSRIFDHLLGCDKVLGRNGGRESCRKGNRKVFHLTGKEIDKNRRSQHFIWTSLLRFSYIKYRINIH